MPLIDLKLRTSIRIRKFQIYIGIVFFIFNSVNNNKLEIFHFQSIFSHHSKIEIKTDCSTYYKRDHGIEKEELTDSYRYGTMYIHTFR